MKASTTRLLFIAVIGTAYAQEKSTYKLSGIVETVETGRVSFYRKPNPRTIYLVDTAIVTKNAFTLMRAESDPELLHMSVKGVGTKLIFLENSNIEIHIDGQKQMKVSGSALHNQYAAYIDTLSQLEALIEQVTDSAYKFDQEERLTVLRKKKRELQLTFIHANDFFSTWIASQCIDEWTSADEIDSIISTFPEKMRSSRYLTAMKAQAEKVRHLGIGKPAPDFQLPDSAGRMVSLSSFRGKFVLLDFWASWCGPCRAENPVLLKQYEKYRQKEFQIVSVSLDTNSDAWKNAISKDGVYWIHLQDKNAFSGVAATQYELFEVPTKYLLDPDGKIIARNPKAKDLDVILAKKMK